MFKILLLQGTNGNYLGKREPSAYGSTTVDQVDTQLHQHAHEQDYSLETFSTKYRRRGDQTART